MKLITTIVKLSMLLILIGQICMSDSKSQSATLESRVKKLDKDIKPADLAGISPTIIKAIAAKIEYNEDLSKSVLLDGSKHNKFLILGDTGQVNTYFKEYLERSLKKKQDKLNELTEGTFENFEKVMKANEATEYHQGIILGDFVYTENKGDDIVLDEIKNDTDLKTLKDSRKMTHKMPDGKTEEVLTLFQKRVSESANKLNNLLANNYSPKIPVWLLLSGNHSYDVDYQVERTVMNSDKSKVRIYKNSKVHVSEHACFADLSFGDLVCLNKTYKECLGPRNPLTNSRYGKDEDQTMASLAKTIEAILTLKLCRDKWRIIRTHAAPFNSEVDQHYLFNSFEGEVKCRVRKAIDGLEISDKDMMGYQELIKKINESKVNLSYEMLRDNSQGIRATKKKDMSTIKAVENRLFKCDIEGKAKNYSVMEIVDSSAPHFYLGSHLHASQLLFAPTKMNKHTFNEFKQSDESKCHKGCQEINFIKKYDKLVPEVPYVPVECNTAGLVREDTFEINKDKPEYNIIFVIGNSGRFLDPFSKGNQSASHIVWQRINTSKVGLAIDMLKPEKGFAGPPAEVQKILDADKDTAYGFAELVTASNDVATVEFKELDPTDQKIKTVLKITLKKGTDKTYPDYKNDNGWLKVQRPTLENPNPTAPTHKRKLRKVK